MKRHSQVASGLFLIFGSLFIFVLLHVPQLVRAESEASADDAAISDAICPIVYPMDETPREDGYHYIFYGNAFFINKQGYLLTAAHVLSAFRNGGGQPYILVSRPHAPAVLQKADLVGVDWQHDVALLRANPNPFGGDYKVAFLPLQTKSLGAGTEITAVALRPPKVQNAHTFQAPIHDDFAGQIVDYQFTQEEKGASQTELLLFDHEVLRGQSGAPVLSTDTHEVVGIVDGRWLRPRSMGIAAVIAAAKGANANAKTAAAKSEPATMPTATAAAKSDGPSGTAAPPTATSTPAAPPVGAAVRIHYAIALLQQHGIAWQGSLQQEPSSTETTQNPEADEQSQKDVPVPFPISVVAAPYPPQSLFGGEVIFDALVDSSGGLMDAQVIHGDSPFLSEAQAAVQTWSFRPARMEGTDVDARIAIAFEFAEPFLPSPKRRTHSYEEPRDEDDRAPVPTYTVEPEYPVNSVAEGSVVVLGSIDEEGQLTATKVIRDNGPLTAATISAMEQWRFLPGKKAGKNIRSAVIVAAAFRRPALARLNSGGMSQTQRQDR